MSKSSQTTLRGRIIAGATDEELMALGYKAKSIRESRRLNRIGFVRKRKAFKKKNFGEQNIIQKILSGYTREDLLECGYSKRTINQYYSSTLNLKDEDFGPIPAGQISLDIQLFGEERERYERTHQKRLQSNKVR